MNGRSMRSFERENSRSETSLLDRHASTGIKSIDRTIDEG